MDNDHMSLADHLHCDNRIVFCERIGKQMADLSVAGPVFYKK